MKAGSLVFVFALLVLILVAVPASLAVQELEGAAAPALDSLQIGPTPSAITWDKTVNGITWTPDMTLPVQTSDMIEVVEALHPTETGHAFDQIELWQPAHLQLVEWEATAGDVWIDPLGIITWTGEITTLETLTLTKWFHVEPCTWTLTFLEESLSWDELLLEERPVEIHKTPPLLSIEAEGASEGPSPVYPGQPVPFTLIYTNSGGYENDVEIRNTFPPEAPFLRSSPPPDRVDDNGLWAEWDVGDLEQGDVGSIDVTVLVNYGLPVSTTFEVWDGIYNHVDELQDDVWIPFHIELLPVIWDKTVDGVNWAPGMEITVQTSDTIQIVEAILPVELGHTFTQTERWDPTRLDLVDWQVTGGAVITGNGELLWTGEILTPEPIMLTKWFHVEPCTWLDTLLEESLWWDDILLEERPVEIHKTPPLLSIEAAGGGPVLPGQTVSFGLLYANTGGYENDVEIRVEFPPQAPFLVSFPPPTRVDVNGLWAEWDVGDLAQSDEGQIDVTVHIAHDTPASTTLPILAGVYDHVNVKKDEATVQFHVESPLQWEKTVDGQTWLPGLTITRQTSDTIEVVETLQLQPTSAALATDSATTVDSSEPAAIDSVLWDQTRSSSLFFPSQDFASVFDAYDIYAADDFQNQTPWAIGRITIQGGWPTGPVDLLNASALHWYIFPDENGDPAGIPGDGSEIWHVSLPPTDPQVLLGTESFIGNVQLSPAAPINLPAGTWWLVFFPSIGENLDVRYGWQGAPGQVWREYGQLNNPGGGFTQLEPGWNDNPNRADYSFRLDGLATPPATFAQVERWDPAHLTLVDWQVTGGVVITGDGELNWTGEINGPATIVLTKHFHVEPCTWTQTELDEELWLSGALLEERPVTIQKLAPVLSLTATGGGEVLPDEQSHLTFFYANTGGYENDAWIRSTFPAEAPFQTSLPVPHRVDPAGLWAEWDLGDLAQGDHGSIDLTVSVSVRAQPETILQVISGLYDHTDVERSTATADLIVTTSPIPTRRVLYLPIVLRIAAP